jgi:hypothetical protein
VELLSTETEGHVKLAEIRQQQRRFDDAMLHWRHVTRIRKLEPDGLLGLARTRFRRRPPGADATLRSWKRPTGLPITSCARSCPSSASNGRRSNSNGRLNR